MMVLPDWGDPRVPDRIWQRIYPCPLTGCWLWGGGTNHGYGRARVDRVLWYLHILVYRRLVGGYDSALVLDHYWCDTPACCNPGHVRPVTARVNILRGTCPAAQLARLEMCQAGLHELSGANLKIETNGARRCIECRRIRRRAAREAARGLLAA